MTTWILRALTAGGVWIAMMAFLLLGDRTPQPALLAATVGAIAMCTWLVTDLEQLTEPADWRLSGEEVIRSRGDDQRMRNIQRQLQAHAETGRPLNLVLPAIIELLDDRVATKYGVDRLTDPERYGQIVGPELNALAAATPDTVRLRNPRTVAQLLTRIESL